MDFKLRATNKKKTNFKTHLLYRITQTKTAEREYEMLERLLIKIKSELSLDLFSINQLFFGGGIVVSISIHCSL